MSETKKKYNYTQFGTVQVSKKFNPDDENEPLRYCIKLGPNRDKKSGRVYGENVFPITLANGKVLEEGDYLTLFSIPEALKEKLKDGKIDQETYDFLTSYLKFDIKIKEPVSSGKKGSNDSGSDDVNF